MSTFISRLESSGTGITVAIKDLIDVAGTITTAGSRAVADKASVATNDAPLLAGFRAAGARIVGKTNLHELAMLPLGTNEYYGTPTNPLDSTLIPGGSSSGSAVAVANGDAQIALGSDTGGSIRIPSACCGTAGLKTTHGRVSLEAVWPLAISLDTIGPMARGIGDLLLAMEMLEPGFRPANGPARHIGRVRTAGDPAIDAAIDEALARAEFEVTVVDLDLSVGNDAFMGIFFDEVFRADSAVVRGAVNDVGRDVQEMIDLCEVLRVDETTYRATQRRWRAMLDELFGRVELLALPTMPIFPPALSDLGDDRTQVITDVTSHVAPFNAAGVPATAQPVPVRGYHLPASLQLVGPVGAEELLLPTAQKVEDALAS